MGFDPLSIGLMAAGTLVSTAGQYAAGQATKDQAEYRAEVAQQNKKWAEAAGAARESAQGMKTKAEQGRLRAQLGASGVDVSSGSSADVLDAVATLGALDLATIRTNTAQEAYGFETQSELAKAEGEAAETVGALGAFSSLISGATDISKKYSSWKGA